MDIEVPAGLRALPSRPRPWRGAALLALWLVGSAVLGARDEPSISDPVPLALSSMGGGEDAGRDSEAVGLPRASAEASPAVEILLREVLDRNPGLTALRHGVAAARHRVPQAGALEDPMAGLVLSNLPLESLALDQTPMTGIELRWSQKLPWPGKRALRTQVAELGVDVAREEVEEAALRLVAETRIAWYELGFLDRALRISRRNQEILQDLAAISEEKYAVGRGVQADALRAQVALSRVLDRIFDLEARRDATRARLNALRNRPPGTDLPPPPGLVREMLALDLESLSALAESQRPILARLRHAVDQTEVRVALARKELRPDFTVGGAYRIRDEMEMDPVEGEDFVSASILVNVPLWSRNKQKARVAESREMARRARRMLEEARTAIRGRLDALTARMAGLDREILLYERGILDQARQSLASSRAAYEVDRLDFLSYLDSWKVLLEEEIDYARAVTNYRQILARLEAEVGAGVAETAGEEMGR